MNKIATIKNIAAMILTKIGISNFFLARNMNLISIESTTGSIQSSYD